MNNKEKYIKSIENLINNPNVSAETKQLAGLNYLASEISYQLEQINKNLEKIANKDFVQIGEISRTINKGDFIKENYVYPLDNNKIWADINKYEPIEELNLGTKSQHVDKNIIS